VSHEHVAAHLTGAVLAALALPALVVPGRSTALLVTACAVAGASTALLPASRLVVLGGALVVGAAILFGQTVQTPLLVVSGLVLGCGVGLVAGRAAGRPRAALAVGAGAGLALLVVVHQAGTDRGVRVIAAALAVVAVVARVAFDPRARARPGVASRVAGTAASLAAVAVALWIGANGATVTWFGGLVSHGPRDRPEVAITFDDGPNVSATLAVARILDRHGAKGTFFSVGRAVDARPGITRALVRDGQIVGNHSFHHDSVRWLDPRYPELERTQTAIRREAGVCPAFFRPPHGQHTPFMAWVVHRHGMTMVTWDVSADDWATRDPGLIARRVLRKVRAGSIIDLHDGLDGHVGVDRTVLVRALPAILDGLHARGLRVVGLDQLIGRPAYLHPCT
jgi:peptidoglycan/xylan/chitin deacetylase (PgdA/CDA1 family)